MTFLVRKDLVASEPVQQLTKFAHLQVLKLVVKAAKTQESSEVIGKRLQELPRHLVEHLFQSAFFNGHSNVAIFKKKSYACEVNVYPPSLLADLRQMSGLSFFRLWSMFFDESHTKKIGFEINDIKFGENLLCFKPIYKSVLEDLVLTYNWILRNDFIRLLNSLRHLKRLTVYVKCKNADIVLQDLIAVSTKLKSFNLAAKDTYVSKLSMSKNAAANFFRSQSELEELNMLNWNVNGDERHEIFELLGGLQKLKKLHFTFSAITDFKLVSSLISLEEIMLVPEIPQLFQTFFDEDVLDIALAKKDIKIRLSGLILTQRKLNVLSQNSCFVEQLRELDCTIEKDTYERFTLSRSNFNFHNLEKLSIIIPEFDHSVVAKLPNLREFSGIFTSSATTYDHQQLSQLLISCPKLEKFTVKAPMITAFYIFPPIEDHTIIPNLKSLCLSELRSDFCERAMTDSILEKVVGACPNLREIWLPNVMITKHQKESFAKKSFMAF